MANPSALSKALARIGDRWSLLVVEALLDAPRRFADLEQSVVGISTNVLAARLRHLEAERVVLAVPYSERPRRFAYELTDAGRDLAGAVRMLSQWSTDHATAASGRRGDEAGAGGRDDRAGAPRHDLCGTPMAAVWWCPTCEERGGAEPAEAVWV